MEYKFILLALSVLVLVNNSFSATPDMLSGIIKAALSFIKTKNTTISEILLKIPENFNDIAIGSLKLNNFEIYGLDTLTYSKEDVNVTALPTEDTSTRNYISVNLHFDEIGIKSAYDMDIGVIDLLPLYGDGEFKVGLKDINFFIELELTDILYHNMSIANLNMQLSIRHSKENYITNFLNNEEFSKNLTDILNSLVYGFCMFYDYEKECIDCVLSNVLEFVINTLLGAGSNKPSIECSCLKKNNFEIQDNLENYLSTVDMELWSDQIKSNEELMNVFYQIRDDIV